MQTHPKLSLIEYFQEIPDPRVQGRCDHEPIDVLVIAVYMLLCGGSGFDDMADFGRAEHEWLRTFLRLWAPLLLPSCTGGPHRSLPVVPLARGQRVLRGGSGGVAKGFRRGSRGADGL